MKKVKNVKLLLNKKKVSNLTRNGIRGGGFSDAADCQHTAIENCTSDAPASFAANCSHNRPSVFGQGACTTVEIPN